MKHMLMFLACLVALAPRAPAQWNQVSLPVSANLHGLAFASPRTGCIVSDNGWILRTTNSGVNWGLVPSPTTGMLTEATFLDSMRGWIVGAYDLLSTVNGGSSWSVDYDYAPYFPTYYFGVCVRQTPGGITGWVVGGRDATLMSYIGMTNGSGVWYPQNLGFAGRLVGVDFISDKLGWAAGERGLILNTTNSGTWWNQQPSTTDTGFNSIRFFDSEVGIVVGAWGKILKTTNGGNTWRSIWYPGNETLFKIWIHSALEAYAVGGNNTVLRTTDQGETWARQTVNASSSSFEDIVFVSETEGWAVGTNGVLVHTTNGGGLTWASPSESGVPSEHNLYACYPNPFNPSTNISYDIASQAHVTIKIYSVLGQEVTTLVDEVRTAGRYTTIWNAAGNSSGTYWCRMTLDGLSLNQRMVLVK
jgi:photosystem II stability/assembly factor-like uncharacterized protein